VNCDVTNVCVSVREQIPEIIVHCASFLWNCGCWPWLGHLLVALRCVMYFRL